MAKSSFSTATFTICAGFGKNVGAFLLRLPGGGQNSLKSKPSLKQELGRGNFSDFSGGVLLRQECVTEAETAHAKKLTLSQEALETPGSERALPVYSSPQRGPQPRSGV